MLEIYSALIHFHLDGRINILYQGTIFIWKDGWNRSIMMVECSECPGYPLSIDTKRCERSLYRAFTELNGANRHVSSELAKFCRRQLNTQYFGRQNVSSPENTGCCSHAPLMYMWCTCFNDFLEHLGMQTVTQELHNTEQSTESSTARNQEKTN